MERLRKYYNQDDGITTQLGNSEGAQRIHPENPIDLVKQAKERLATLCALGETTVPAIPENIDLDNDWSDLLKTLLGVSEFAEQDVIAYRHDIVERRKQLCYPINMLRIVLDEQKRSKYQVSFSEDRKIAGLIGEGYAKMSEREDPVTGVTVTPAQNVQETLRITASNPDSFHALLFITEADDKKMPVYGKEWTNETTKSGAPTFDDFGETHFGVVIGDNYFKKVGVSGVHEVLGEETDPWHFALPWSVWKEGITWAKRGRHTKTHPCEQLKLREYIDKYESIRLWNFRDLVYDWEKSARKRDDVKEHTYFAYYSAELAFLTLAARNSGDSEFKAEHYEKYADSLEDLCKAVKEAGVDKEDTKKPEVMMPHALRWAGFDSEDQLFDYVDDKLPKFSQDFLKQMLES